MKSQIRNSCAVALLETFDGVIVLIHDETISEIERCVFYDLANTVASTYRLP